MKQCVRKKEYIQFSTHIDIKKEIRNTPFFFKKLKKLIYTNTALTSV